MSNINHLWKCMFFFPSVPTMPGLSCREVRNKKNKKCCLLIINKKYPENDHCVTTKEQLFWSKLVWKLFPKFLLKFSKTSWLRKIISNSVHLIWYSHNWLNHIIDFWLNTYTIWIYSTKLKWILLQNYNIQIVLDCGYILTIKVLNMTSLNIPEAFHVLYGIKISCCNVNSSLCHLWGKLAAPAPC